RQGSAARDRHHGRKCRKNQGLVLPLSRNWILAFQSLGAIDSTTWCRTQGPMFAVLRRREAIMIERYSDHAANERTFLAWVRTAIAVMAFGFLVEKFDLFLEIAARSSGARVPAMGGQLLANLAGLLLIALGGVTMVLAIVRFRKTSL